MRRHLFRTRCGSGADWYNIPVRAKQPYWQNYWYDLLFRCERTPSFEPIGPGGPRQVPNTWPATRSLDEFADWVLAEAVEDLDDLRGELRMLVYTEATPGPDTEPVLVRTVELGRRRPSPSASSG